MLKKNKEFTNMTHTQQRLYPLTSPQREIWFDQQIHEGIPLYNLGGYVKIPGAINPVLFEQAVNSLAFMILIPITDINKSIGYAKSCIHKKLIKHFSLSSNSIIKLQPC
jgi:hypothetical protein